MSDRPGIRGILLDFYGTVVDEDDDTIARICDTIAGSHGTLTPAEVGSSWSASFASATASAVGAAFKNQRDLAVDSLQAVLASIGSPLNARELCTPQFDFWRRPDLRAGSREFLEMCTLPVCVVSNIDNDDLDAAIRHHGLNLQNRSTSENAHAYKPRPEMFEAALDTLGLGPHEVIHVGDSPSSDVAGATRLGIRTAWVNPKRRRLPEGLFTDLEIQDLRELLQVLDR